MNPKVSIIIPVYNGSNYMKEAIDSALGQTYKNCEVIVVNDGSTDNGKTAELAKSYGERIVYLEKKNGGVASALNMGIRNMTGEYFAWLSHDDVYYPNKIEEQIKALKTNGNMKAPLYGNWDMLLMPEGQVKKRCPEYRYSMEQLQNGVFPVLLGLVNGCTILIHKSHFERVGLFKEELLTAQDVDMWFRIFRNQHVVFVEKPLIKYRFHEEQGSRVISDFLANCEEIQMYMVKNMKKQEVAGLFGSYYKFYFDMMRMAEKNKWEVCEKELYQLFLKEEEPVCNYQKKFHGRIILYCAGKNGRHLLRDLAFRGINADFFSDGNQGLWNTRIDGVTCIPPEEIKQDDFIIVTKDYPEVIVKNLKQKGFVHVTSYDEIAHDLYTSIPEKRLVKEYVEERL